MKAKLHAALLELRSRVRRYAEKGYSSTLRTDSGICGNLRIMTGRWDEYNLCEKLCDKWPGRSSETCYPVGGYDEFCEEELNGTMWNNPRRLELLDWLIEETKQ